MVTDAMIHKDRTTLAAIIISLIVHGVILLPFVKDIVERELKLSTVEEVIVPPLEFELVSPPEQPTPSRNLSKYLSTVSSEARDVVETDKKTDVPHGEGVVPIPDTPSREQGVEGGGESELPPLPEEESDLGEALRRSKFTEQISPRKELSFPQEQIDYKHEGSARASIGGISLNTTAWDFAPYLLDLKYRIKQHWIPPLAFTALGAIHGYTWVRFKIMPDGSMRDLEVVEEVGHESLTRSSIGAIRGAVPFRALPSEFPEKYLEITFGFYYLLPGDEVEYFKDRERSE